MRKTRFSEYLPRAAIYLRYLFPVLTGVVLTVLSFFYLVRYYQGGEAYVQTLFRFYYNTLSASHQYLGSGNTQAGKNALYGWLTAGAVGGILLYLLGMFFAVFALVLFLRAFRKSEETAAARRMKVLFKIAFPNRVCLFLSNCLFLPVALFPSYFSMVAGKVAGVSRTEILYVERNIPLIVTAVLTVLTLALAIFAAVREKQERLNPFALDRALSAADLNPGSPETETEQETTCRDSELPEEATPTGSDDET